MTATSIHMPPAPPKQSIWPTVTAVLGILSLLGAMYSTAGREQQRITATEAAIVEVKARVTALETSAAKSAETQAGMASDIRWIRASLEDLLRYKNQNSRQ